MNETDVFTLKTSSLIADDWIRIKEMVRGYPSALEKKRWKIEAVPFFAHAYELYGRRASFSLLLPDFFLRMYLIPASSLEAHPDDWFAHAASYHKTFIQELHTTIAEYLLFHQHDS